ncbi:hypothetical protein EASAB2608_00198 [Streptomyces sp. EAS-AB2608]|nr:hypothetical protein EASAB2608_00198 [Streptomyces sp. EAS-AB2608]
MLRHSDSHTEALSPPPELLPGIDPDAHHPTTSIRLPPGAVLALYTDGLIESPGIDVDDAISALAELLGCRRRSRRGGTRATAGAGLGCDDAHLIGRVLGP